MTNKSIEDITKESYLYLWQAYCDKKMKLEAANDEIERLRAALRYIANDYVELSHDKVLWQRNYHMKMARKALEASYKDETVESKPLDDNF